MPTADVPVQTSPTREFPPCAFALPFCSPLSHRRRSARHRVGLGDHRPQRQRRLLEGGAERPGARQLQRAREALERARLGRAQRDPADAGRASRSSSSSTTPAATAPTSATSGRPSRTPAAVRRPASCSGSSPAARRADGSYWALQSWQRVLPNYGLSATPKQSVWELRLSHFRGALPVLTVQAELGLPQVPPHLRLVHLSRPPGPRLQVDVGRRPARHLRPQPLPRHVRLGLRQGLAAREQLPDAQGHRQVLLRLLPPRRPPRGPRHASTAPRSSAPASLPDIYWEADALGAYDKAFDLQHARGAEAVPRRRPALQGGLIAASTVERMPPRTVGRSGERAAESGRCGGTPSGWPSPPSRSRATRLGLTVVVARLARARAAARRDLGRAPGGVPRAPARGRRLRGLAARRRPARTGAALRPRRAADRDVARGRTSVRAAAGRCWTAPSAGSSASSAASSTPATTPSSSAGSSGPSRAPTSPPLLRLGGDYRPA